MTRPQYTEVDDHFESIAIVGTGNSLKGVNLAFSEDVAVLAVNSAINHLTRTDIWFTLDPSPSNVTIMRRPIRGVTYYAAVPENFSGAPRHVNLLRRVVGTGHGHYQTKAGLSNDRGAIHTGNSAWGALQLAAHLGAEKVALFGIDGQGGYHYGGAPRELSMLPALFASAVGDLAARGIDVINGSPDSTVDCFRRYAPEDAMRWINSR